MKFVWNIKMHKKKGWWDIFKIMGCLIILAGFTGCTSGPLLFRPKAPLPSDEMELIRITPGRLVKIGQIIILGTDNPKLDKGGLPIGKGQCPLCHTFFKEQITDRSPNMAGVEALSQNRIKEDRYRMFAEKYSSGEPHSRIKPHSQSGGEYLIESLYCPDCY